jgi:hypothetical protein
MMRRVSQKNRTITQHADQAELLADHRQQEVGVRLGQPVQLSTLPPRPTPKISPRPMAISECDSW